MSGEFGDWDIAMLLIFIKKAQQTSEMWSAMISSFWCVIRIALLKLRRTTKYY